MQPDDHQKDTWQPPTPQPTQSPYVAPPADVDPQPQSPPLDSPQQAPIAQPVNLDEPLPAETAPVDAPTSAEGNIVDETAVYWQANEYIHRDKNALWYIVFVLVVLVLIAAAILLMHTWTFAILVLVMAIALIVYTRRPPRVLNYTLSRQGLHINDQLYPFADFKGFTVIHGDDEYSIMLIPVKRFRPGVTVYFPEESGEAIVDMLAARMPMQQTKLDLVDQIIRKLRI